MNLFVSTGRQNITAAYLPTIAETNLEKQYQAASVKDQARSRVPGKTYVRTQQPPPPQQPTPKKQNPQCPLPPVLANCCARPSWKYECAKKTQRTCSVNGDNGAWLSYSENYRKLYRQSQETTAKLYDGSPYKSFVNNQFSSSFK